MYSSEGYRRSGREARSSIAEKYVQLKDIANRKQDDLTIDQKISPLIIYKTVILLKTTVAKVSHESICNEWTIKTFPCKIERSSSLQQILYSIGIWHIPSLGKEWERSSSMSYPDPPELIITSEVTDMLMKRISRAFNWTTKHHLQHVLLLTVIETWRRRH